MMRSSVHYARGLHALILLIRRRLKFSPQTPVLAHQLADAFPSSPLPPFGNTRLRQARQRLHPVTLFASSAALSRNPAASAFSPSSSSSISTSRTWPPQPRHTLVLPPIAAVAEGEATRDAGGEEPSPVLPASLQTAPSLTASLLLVLKSKPTRQQAPKPSQIAPTQRPTLRLTMAQCAGSVLSPSNIGPYPSATTGRAMSAPCVFAHSTRRRSARSARSVPAVIRVTRKIPTLTPCLSH